jgi:hypothetical protein
MFVALVYRLLVTMLSWFALLVRSSSAKDGEILVPRHEVAVLRRADPRPRLSWTDRAFPAALARIMPRGCAWRIVTPGASLSALLSLRRTLQKSSKEWETGPTMVVGPPGTPNVPPVCFPVY